MSYTRSALASARKRVWRASPITGMYATPLCLLSGPLTTPEEKYDVFQRAIAAALNAWDPLQVSYSAREHLTGEPARCFPSLKSSFEPQCPV